MQVGAFLLQSRHQNTKAEGLKMIGWIVDLIGWVMGRWNKLSEEEKQKIIEVIVEYSSKIFRDFYRSQNGNGEKNV